ncbi:MAG TPA: extracellular solute-binding protein, partial [Solirubrobacteraceae bacterium]
PRQTILIETPIAVTANSSHAAAAQAFVSWLLTPTAQTIWAKHGYRPVLASVRAAFASEFPTPPQLFTIKSLGGWKVVSREFFASSTGSVTKIEAAAGVPTASR